MAWTKEERDRAFEAQKKADEARASKEEEILLELEEKHGFLGVKIDCVRGAEGMVVVKRPSPVAFKSFANKGQNISTEDMEKLVKGCLLYPEPHEFVKLVSEQPALVPMLANKVVALGGLTKEQTEK